MAPPPATAMLHGEMRISMPSVLVEDTPPSDPIELVS